MKDCATGKISYPTKGRAKRSLAAFRVKIPDPHHYNAYLCETCGSWHLGHAPGAGHKKKQAQIHKQFRAPRWRENTAELESLTEGGDAN